MDRRLATRLATDAKAMKAGYKLDNFTKNSKDLKDFECVMWVLFFIVCFQLIVFLLHPLKDAKEYYETQSMWDVEMAIIYVENVLFSTQLPIANLLNVQHVANRPLRVSNNLWSKPLK